MTYRLFHIYGLKEYNDDDINIFAMMFDKFRNFRKKKFHLRPNKVASKHVEQKIEDFQRHQGEKTLRLMYLGTNI